MNNNHTVLEIVALVVEDITILAEVESISHVDNTINMNLYPNRVCISLIYDFISKYTHNFSIDSVDLGDYTAEYTITIRDQLHEQ